MTNEPEFPESEGQKESPSASEPVGESTAETTEFDQLGDDLPEIDDLFGSEDDGVADSVLSGSELPDSELPDSELPDSELRDSEFPDSEFPDSEDTDLLASEDELYGGEAAESEAEQANDEPGLGEDEDQDEQASAQDDEANSSASAGTPPPPTIPGPVPVARQLTRDPYTSFGGVASGLSHHFGIDVSIIRIAFVALTVVGGGFGLLLYLLGWIVIPRAKFWPPVPRSQASAGVGGRELGFVLIGLGLLILWFSVGGIGAQIVVPLLLVGGGVWFLSQPDRRLLSAPAAGDVARAAMPPMAPSTAGQPAAGLASTPQPGGSGPAPIYTMPYQGAPVPPRSRKRRVLIPLVIIGIFTLPLLMIVGSIAFLVATEGEWETTVDGITIENDIGSVVEAPKTFEDIPRSIDGGAGDFVLDLSGIDPETFTGDPIPVEIENNFGSVLVIVPEDMGIDVQAKVTAGDIRVFDKEASGIGGSLSYGAGDPMIDLDISVDAGEIVVASTEDAEDFEPWFADDEGFEWVDSGETEVDINPFDD